MAADLTYIRISVGDTDSTNYAYTDAQINAMLTKFVNENLTIAKLLRGLAAKAAQQTSVSAGGVSESTSPAELLKQAEAFEALAAAEGYDPTGGDIAYDDIVEIGNSEFVTEEILINNILNEI